MLCQIIAKCINQRMSLRGPKGRGNLLVKTPDQQNAESAHQSRIEILPVGIHSHNQRCLSITAPAFDLFFAFDGCADVGGFLEVHQFCHIIPRSKAVLIRMISMLVHPADQIVRHTGIKDSAVPIGLRYTHSSSCFRYPTWYREIATALRASQ